MAVVKKYIEPPKWWSLTHMNETVPVFIRAVESMCLEAGLVKSNIADNMDTDNIVLPPFPMTGAYNSYENICSKKLSFDLNDSMQVNLPVRIEFTFGYYTYAENASTAEAYYPYYNYISTRIGIVDPSTNNFRSSHVFNSAHKYGYSSQLSDASFYVFDDYRPMTSFSGMDSFISVSDGFVAMCILPEFSETYNYSHTHSTEILFLLERSFDNTNAPTAENINIISVTNNDIQSAGRLHNYVLSNGGVPIVTLDTMRYYATPHVYNKGNLVLYPFLHFNTDYTMQQSPNYCGIRDSVLSAGSEAMVSVDGGAPTRFIKTSVRDNTNHPTDNVGCALLFKFE